MSNKKTTSNVVKLEIVHKADRFDQLMDDEDFFAELVYQINKNFILDVEACHDHDKQSFFNRMREAGQKKN